MHAIDSLDAAIVVTYLLAVLGIGVWVARGQRDVADYLLGGRNLPWWAVLGSIVATETSTVTFLSVPGYSFTQGGNFRFLQLALGYMMGRVVIAVVLLPQYFRGEIFTAYELLHRRFGGMTKVLASAIFLVTRNLADGLRLYLTAIVLERLGGLSLSQSVVLLGTVTIVYTMFGGMKSVVWNDCIQLVIYLIGAVAAGVVIMEQIPGGASAIVQYGQEHGKFVMFDFALDWTRPYTFWAGLVGGMFLTTATHGADQMMVQRLLCARSRRAAAQALVASGGVVFLQFALFLSLGVALAAYYARHPPAEAFTKSDQAFADFIVHHLPSGIRGLTLAAVFAVAMSTLSSSLNSSASAAVHDLLLSARPSLAHSPRLLRVSRLLTVAFGIVQIGVASAGPYLAQRVVDSVLAIAGFSTGVILGVFLLGVLTSGVRQRAALVGMVGGLIVMSCVAFGSQLAWPWFSLVGAATTWIVGYTSERMFGHRVGAVGKPRTTENTENTEARQE